MESAFFSLDLISKRLVIHLRSNLRAIANFDFEIPKLHRLHHLHRRGKQGPSSTKRRRDRINEKMRALQELIPNCNKVDKASMLDESYIFFMKLYFRQQVSFPEDEKVSGSK